MKKGIKKRLVWSYLLLIIFTVAVFESIILSALFVYYHGGVKQALKDQGATFASFYEQELIEGKFEENAQQYLSQYQFLVNAQVQLVDLRGNVLAETHKGRENNILNKEDVKTGLSGETGYWYGKIDREKVLSVSSPLIAGGENVGVIRMTTSMKQLNDVFINHSLLLLSIGGVVIFLAAALSFFLAHTITRPVSLITKAAEQMAAGNLSTKIELGADDEIGKLAETLNFMAQQVQQHEQMKNEFIASVSHELRTPLTSVKGWAVTLHSITDDNFFKEGLEIITAESDRLNTLVSDLLDLSSLSSGKLTFEFEEFPLQTLIEHAVQQLKPRAEKKGIKLTANLVPAIEIVAENIDAKENRAGEKEASDDLSMLKIKADKNRLKQVLINLLDNAIKFTPEDGMITVRLQKKRNEAIIFIQDTGIGIGKHKLSAVKDKFVKGEMKGAGTGLGLAICEEIIKAHNGVFFLDSEPGKGTTAEIRLPL
ncbi:ATP-binding protein [Metabacillus litoralis]|uniref:HAMP domain-containing sensor histidine kinase n=1 Tax=Metabacillus litoralis TaxID=152268 RepID=UPI00203F05A6|nr:HAMP domain-containing sensor histidine kinase [Metabacillus litoralis]MCM3654338.1 HAMP domain-containing histidine kinase [Metabacillus litoralis]